MATQLLSKNQKSRLFLGTLLVVSLLLFFSAEKIDEQAQSGLYGVLSHLAAMLLAAVVAAAFFSFRDVREMFAASISTLLLDGEIASHLGTGLRRRLRDRLLLEDLRGEVSELHAEVREHLEAVERESLSLPHHHNFSATLTIRDDPAYPTLLQCHTLESYKVSTRHCKNGKAKYTLHVYSEISNQDGKINVEHLLKSFSVKVGAQHFGPLDATTKPKKSAGLDVIVVSLQKEIEVDREIEVRVEYESLIGRTDPTEIRGIRYPTSGFRYTLTYNDAMFYDVAWFKALSSKEAQEDLYGRENVELTPNGITASTHKWLLPGEGVVLYWFPKTPA